MSAAGTDSIESPLQARRRVSRHGSVALLAMLAPAIGFPLLLTFSSRFDRFSFLNSPHEWPAELFVIAIFGLLATFGGVLDWRFHRSGDTAVGKPEHRAHVLALATGGLPLFVLMTFASALTSPSRYLLLLPILCVALYTNALICYDEFSFHTRRCDSFETATHRLLVFGNTIAWLAWMHWCFVRSAWSTL